MQRIQSTVLKKPCLEPSFKESFINFWTFRRGVFSCLDSNFDSLILSLWNENHFIGKMVDGHLELGGGKTRWSCMALLFHFLELTGGGGLPKARIARISCALFSCARIEFVRV